MTTTDETTDAESRYLSDPATRPLRIVGYPKRRPARAGDDQLAVPPARDRRTGPSYGDFFADPGSGEAADGAAASATGTESGSVASSSADAGTAAAAPDADDAASRS